MPCTSDSADSETVPADTTATDDTPQIRALYQERAHLVAALAVQWPAVRTAATDLPGWWIVYVHTPPGQMSWHIHPADVDLFPLSRVPQVNPAHPLAQYDGHTTQEKYARLAALTQQVADGKADHPEAPLPGPA